MLIVLDTNVIVSGLINPDGAPGRILDLILANVVRVAFDDRVIAEYEEVLTRAPFSFPRRQVDAFLDHIRLNGVLVSTSPLPQGDYPDPTDLPFAEVALAAAVDLLVTGNASHFTFLSKHGVTILSPGEFLQRL